MTDDTNDAFEQALRQAAQQGAHRLDVGPLDAHLNADLIVGHLQRCIGPDLRSRVVSHLSRCTACCDKLELAAELLKVEPIGLTTTIPAERPLDVGPMLIELAVAVEPSSLRVLSSNAEMRVGMAAATRRGTGPAGVAFQRRLQDGATLQLELLEAGAGRLSLNAGLDPAPRGARISLIDHGRLSSTRPLKRGQAMFRGLPLHTIYLRVEAPGHVLGHIRLDLTDETA